MGRLLSNFVDNYNRLPSNEKDDDCQGITSFVEGVKLYRELKNKYDISIDNYKIITPHGTIETGWHDYGITYIFTMHGSQETQETQPIKIEFSDGGPLLKYLSEIK